MKNEVMAVIGDGDINIDTFFQSLSAEKQAHSRQTAKIAQQLLEWAIPEDPENYGSISPPEVGRAALYHDIGLTLIPLRILDKTSDLTGPEFRVLQQHTTYGASILDRVRKASPDTPAQEAFWTLAAEIALGHHERWDGKGYPYGQLAMTVPLEVRAVSIAEAFDNMVRGAPYRMALPPEYALLEISQNAGSQFDPFLSRVFLAHRATLLDQAHEFTAAV